MVSEEIRHEETVPNTATPGVRCSKPRADGPLFSAEFLAICAGAIDRAAPCREMDIAVHGLLFGERAVLPIKIESSQAGIPCLSVIPPAIPPYSTGDLEYAIDGIRSASKRISDAATIIIKFSPNCAEFDVIINGLEPIRNQNLKVALCCWIIKICMEMPVGN